MTPERIAELKALCGAVPGGKWKLWTSNSYRRFKDENGMPVIEPTIQASDGHPDLFLATGVAQFIEEASTALPECLDEIEWLRQALERLTKELRSFQYLGYFTNDHWQGVIDNAEAALSQSNHGGQASQLQGNIYQSPCPKNGGYPHMFSGQKTYDGRYACRHCGLLPLAPSGKEGE